MITMQRRNTNMVLGGIFLFLLLQTFPSIVHVRGSESKAEDVLQLEDNPCRPISVNGRMIPTAPEYMPSFPASVNGIKHVKRHFVCKPVLPTDVNAICQNNDGSYNCTCNPGFQETADSNVCEDVNECEAGISPCTNAMCQNNDGSYTCTCNPGFQATADSSVCEDVNECEAGTSPCTNAMCQNNDGSYTCTCNPGFQATPNSSVCKESVKIFVTDAFSDYKIFVADLGDELNFTSIPATKKPCHITYDSVDKMIYWSDWWDGKQIVRADVYGGNMENVTVYGYNEDTPHRSVWNEEEETVVMIKDFVIYLETIELPDGIAIAETSRTLYIAYYWKRKITSVLIGKESLLTGEETDFVTLDEGPLSLEVDEGHEGEKYLYWTLEGGRIQRKSLDGNGTIQELYHNSNLSNLRGLSIGPVSGGLQSIFFCEENSGSTFYIEVNAGGNVERTIKLTPVPGFGDDGRYVRDITYFDGSIYWAKRSNPPAIAVMTNYQYDNRSFEIKETSEIIKQPWKLHITLL